MENKVTADYVDEEGRLHCGICGKRKQMKVSLMGFEHVVACLTILSLMAGVCSIS